MISIRLPAILAFGVIVYAAWGVYEQGMQVVAEQKKVNQEVEEWSRVYEGLRPVMKQWQLTFHDVSKAQDALNVFNLLAFDQYQLSVSLDAIRISNVESLSSSGVALDLKRVCIVDKAGQQLLTVTADTPAQLLTGIVRFSQRQDIEYEQLQYVLQQNKLIAKLSGLCLLVRG